MIKIEAKRFLFIYKKREKCYTNSRRMREWKKKVRGKNIQKKI